MDKFVPIEGLHHWAYRCRDAEETRHFYEDILGLPLIHFIRADNYVGTTGDHVDVYCHLFFEMADKSCVAFFDLGDDVISEPSANTPRWCNHPNGARMELTTETASAEKLAQYRQKARGLCDAWTLEKGKKKAMQMATA